MRKVSKNRQQGKSNGEGRGYRGDNVIQKKSGDTVLLGSSTEANEQHIVTKVSSVRSEQLLRSGILSKLTLW